MEDSYLKYRNISLKQYNSMRIEATADAISFPMSISHVKELFANAQYDDFVVIGKGSNVIFSEDHCLKNVVVTALMNSITYVNRRIVVECGVTLSQLSWFALEHSLEGFEYLEDIPGSVGGALCMNAGTYDDNIGKQVCSVVIYDFKGKTVKTLERNQLNHYWGKRDSYFQHNPCFIIQCTLEASKEGKYEKILEQMLEIKRKRYLKQPRNYPSAGSVFKRPYINDEPIYVWKLLDEAGLRGYKIGDAQVSEKHPGFIVNTGNASGKDIITLLDHCKNVVKEKYGIQLEEEWKIV